MDNNYELHLGDCLEVMKGMDNNSVNAVICDPPYNIGVADWDKIDNYVEWCGLWLAECARITKDNGCLYFFHNDMEQVAELMMHIKIETPYIFSQFIVWNKRFAFSGKKGFLDGYVEIEGLRNYQKMAEYLLYYTFQDKTGLSEIMWRCVYPSRDYIRAEIIRAKGKVNLGKINRALGTADNGGGVASAVLSLDKANPAMITAENYHKLRRWLNSGEEHLQPGKYTYLQDEYEDLLKQYKDLRYEYEGLRYTFNNQKTHHSVWEFDIATKEGHLTPKPKELIKTILLHSTNEGDIVLDPFMGGGPIGEGCANLKRKYIGIEQLEEHYAIAEKRIKTAYSQKVMF